MDDKIYHGPAHGDPHFHSGPPGKPGMPGVSPTVQISELSEDGAYTITVTDAYHSESVRIPVADTDFIAERIDMWLDAHPEATTTVEDGSITIEKLTEEAVEELKAIADGSITEEKLGADVWAEVDDRITKAISKGISVEYGLTDKDFYTVFTIPKSKFKMSLEPINSNPAEPGTIREYVIKNRPALAMNISNTDSFLCNGALYGTDYTQTTHGSIFALKPTDTDFSVFEQGTVLSSLLSLGYTDAMGGWNCLRENGTDKTIDWEYGTYANPNPRQTLAWDDDNWYVYTSYARFSIFGDTETVNLLGKTMAEVLNFCKQRDWDTVCALDGGGSSYVASGEPFCELSINVNNGHWRDCHMCIAFNEVGGV